MQLDDAPPGTRSLGYGQFFGAAAHRSEANGFALAVMRPDPVLEVELHTHDTAHFILHLEGTYLSSAAGAPARACGPTLIYNPPGTTHRDRYERPGGLATGRFLSIGVAAEVTADPWMANASAAAAAAADARCLTSPRALGAAMRILRECRRWDTESSVVAEGLCLELLDAVQVRETDALDGGASWLRRAREVLYDCCGEAVTVRAVASECGVHPVYLARAFRRHFGVSPGAYLRRCRLERAAAGLADSGETLSVVALASGFVDQSHLTKAFRQAYGVTPGAYRELLRG